MLLNDVPIPAAVALLEHVAGGGQVTHDPVGTPLGDAQRVRDFTQAHPGIVPDAQQRSPMIGQEAPLGCHVPTVAIVFEKLAASIDRLPSAKRVNMSDLHAPDDARREMGQLLEQTEGRPALEALGSEYTRRLHQHSADFEATYGLRLVIAKLQRTPYGPPVVTRFS
jgi:hypothetical protein